MSAEVASLANWQGRADVLVVSGLFLKVRTESSSEEIEEVNVNPREIRFKYVPLSAKTLSISYMVLGKLK
jgi:hypothetical protein